jgi:hypothetical protein
MSNITDVSGKAIEFGNGQKYSKAGTTPMNSIVYTNVTVLGQTFAGPSVFAAEWAKIVKAQALIAKWCEADSKEVRYHKQSRYWIVNGGASEARIQRAIDRMGSWGVRRELIRVQLNEMGLASF